MSNELKEGDTFPKGVTFKHIPIDPAALDPLACQIPAPLNVDQILDQTTGNTLIVSVPGAFTPTCTENHIPPILNHLNDLKEKKNIQLVIIMSANDPFVLNAWGKLLLKESKVSSTGPKLMFASDGNAKFSQENGLSVDASANGMGIRSARFALIVQNGTKKVLYLGKEVERGVKYSGVEAILQAKL